MQKKFRNWTDVGIFLAVVRAGSTRAASQALGINQTTVARRIDALEHALGLVLFEKDKRGYRLSDEGKALLESAKTLEEAANALSDKAQDLRVGDNGPIRLTAPHSVFVAGLYEAIAVYRNANPTALFDLISEDKHLDLIAGEADVALRFKDKIETDDLIVRRLSPVDWTFYASHQYAATRSLPKTIDEVKEHPVVAYTDIKRPWIDDAVDPASVVTQCDNIQSMTAALKSGFGIGALPCPNGDLEELLIRCFPPPPDAAQYGWLVISPKAYRRPEVRRFTAFLAPFFKKQFKIWKNTADEELRSRSGTSP